MPTPNTAVGDLLATTINRYSKTAKDNFTKNAPLLAHLKKNGNIKDGGIQIQETIMYQSAGNVKRYTGYEVIDTGVNNSHSAAVYDWKQYAAPVAISGLEMIQNADKERMIDLISGRVEASTAGLKNTVSDDIFSNGTADGGKQIGGTELLIATNPATGTVGGIDRANNVFWRNIVFDATTNGGAATTAANIETYWARVYSKLMRNGEEPDVIVADDFYYSLFEQSQMNKQRYNDGGGNADVGFVGYRFKKAIVINAGGFQGPDAAPWDASVSGGIPYQTALFLNTNYLKLHVAKGRFFETLGDGKRIAINQDAEVQLIGFTGNLAMSCAALQGKMVE